MKTTPGTVITAGTLKKWLVDNKLDKEGNPDTRITITLELPFREEFASSLARMTDGNAVRVTLEKIQHEFAYRDADGEPVDEDQATAEADDGQMKLLGDGEAEVTMVECADCLTEFDETLDKGMDSHCCPECFDAGDRFAEESTVGQASVVPGEETGNPIDQAHGEAEGNGDETAAAV